MNNSTSKSLRWATTILLLIIAGVLVTGCTTAPLVNNGTNYIEIPLQPGWFEGRRVWYITTDMSDPVMAKNADVNLVPALANALPAEPRIPGTPSSIDRIYKFMNFEQGSVLPSIPQPLGGRNTNPQYSPLWQLYAVYWQPGKVPHELHSEQEVLEAEDQGVIRIVPLRIIVNCPVVKVDGELLPGSRIR